MSVSHWLRPVGVEGTEGQHSEQQGDGAPACRSGQDSAPTALFPRYESLHGQAGGFRRGAPGQPGEHLLIPLPFLALQIAPGKAWLAKASSIQGKQAPGWGEGWGWGTREVDSWHPAQFIFQLGHLQVL